MECYFQRGNTALLRAIEEGASEQIISWLLATENGLNVYQRNEVSIFYTDYFRKNQNDNCFNR